MLARFSDKHMILFMVSLVLFMESVDVTVINTAIPSISHALDVNPIDLKIALICYLLSLAIFIPISGWLADKWGIKRVFMLGIIVFTVSSLWCGFSQNLIELIIARLLQGLGGSIMLPVGRLIIARFFSRQELIVAMSRIVMVGALGLMIGPVCGGLITYYFSWSWIFWVNIPVGLFSLLLVYFWMKDMPPQEVLPLDKLGFVLFGCGLAGLIFGLSALSETSAYRLVAVFIMIIAIILLLIYVWHSRGLPNAIVNTELFRLRTFQISVAGNLLSRISFGGLTFLLPLLLQIVLGYSSLSSGLLMAPTAIGVLLAKPLSLYLLRLFGFKRLLILNTLFVALSIWTFMIVNAETSIFLISSFTFLFGFLIALQYTGMNSLAYAELSPKNLSAATSIMSTLQQITQSFGVAVCALFITYFSLTFSSTPILTLTAFHYTFFVMGILTAFSTFIFKRLRQQDGFQMIYGVQ